MVEVPSLAHLFPMLVPQYGAVVWFCKHKFVQLLVPFMVIQANCGPHSWISSQ
jgi:hypothetical protein